jgi:hypothetical protein
VPPNKFRSLPARSHDGAGVATDLLPGRATLSAVNSAGCHPSRSMAGRALTLGFALTLSISVAACGDDDAGSPERFCGEVAENRDQLTSPELAFSDDIQPLIDLYTEIGDLAPLSIQKEWNQIASAYETASTVVVDDPDSVQVATAAIYSAEASAAKVDTWLRTNCAVDIGPVVTLVPHQP